jgi:hypothetical protein
MESNGAASIILPQFLALRQLVSKHHIYHHSHISHICSDQMQTLIHHEPFTIFVLGISDVSIPIHEFLLSVFITQLLTFMLVVFAETTVNDLIVGFLLCSFFPRDTTHSLYMSTSQFRWLAGTDHMSGLGAGSLTYFHL